MRSLIVLVSKIVTLFFIGVASSVSAKDWDPCLYFPGVFREDTRGTLTQIANDLIPRFGLSATAIVCVGVPYDPLDIAMGFPLFRRAENAYITIAIDEHFIREFTGPMVAILAHEIAHSITPNGKHCSLLSPAEYLRCESDVDFAAALVVGKHQVHRAHQMLRQYLAIHKHTVRDIGSIIERIRKREHMLDEWFGDKNKILIPALTQKVLTSRTVSFCC